MTDLPLAVLVNEHTASGAELVAGAIQDDQRGILIGQKTYGKGTVQQIFPLSDKSSLHVTAAEWLTPQRHALDTVGLQPDIAMIPDAQGRDVELGEAVRQLAAKRYRQRQLRKQRPEQQRDGSQLKEQHERGLNPVSDRERD